MRERIRVVTCEGLMVVDLVEATQGALGYGWYKTFSNLKTQWFQVKLSTRLV